MSDYAPPSEEDRLRLSAHRLLHDLDAGARDGLISLFCVEEVAPGAHLLEEGQKNARLFLVLKGSVGVRLPKRSQRLSEVKLATLGPGEIFGEYSLFDGEAVSAAVYAVEATRVAWLEKAALDAFVDANPGIGRRFYESVLAVLAGRLREKNRELDVLTIG